LKRGEEVLVIERDPDNRFLESIRSQGAKIFVGDASLGTVLGDAGVYKACGLFSMINDDLKNLEIGLNARSLRPDLRLILRFFDKEIAEQLRDRLDIHFAMSTSAIAADEFAALLEKYPSEQMTGASGA
jgi:Trk K+ transport system NAD-binding subunit